jgi:hypothetical protein
VEPPDRAALEEKAFRLLTDSEKVPIIHLRKSEHSWTTISSILKRPPSTCRSFSEKWEQTAVLSSGLCENHLAYNDSFKVVASFKIVALFRDR